MILRDDPRVRDILLDAADLPPAERDAFLDAACGGDAALRAQLRLLAGHLEEDGEGERDCPAGPAEVHPARVGRYRIVGPIGEGGMGTVYRAEQEHPVRRTVALKLIKLGMDTRQVIARFQAERQALAMMDHPNIARVFDAGATDAGRPYFVMELVNGVPVTDFCDRRGLDLNQRLALFAQVCQAVQHAHTKGVIHRDLKPSNVLVAEVDGRPVPKVIDFGIAKATQGRLTEQLLTTGGWQWVGTPLYMSPEQADGGDVDTRSDVYSLGVLLYELLCGHTPFSPDAVVGRSCTAVLRMVRETDPALPSARADGANAEALRKRLRGELDAVVMKCLEKEPAARYESASALAADVGRYLRNEPVAARHATGFYRFRKLVRRHRTGFSVAAALLLSLVCGLVATTWEMRRARSAEAEQRTLRLDAEARAYGADMLAAVQAVGANNLARARALLDRHRPGEGDAFDRRGWEWRYLWQQCRSDATSELDKRPGSIQSLSVSGGGHWLAVGERVSGGLTVWDLYNGKVVARPPAGVDYVDVAFPRAGDRFAFTSVESVGQGPKRTMLHVCDAASGRVTAGAPLNNVSMGLAFSGDGKTLLSMTGGSDGQLTWWSFPELTRVRTLPLQDDHDASNVDFAASPDLRTAAVGTNSEIDVYDLAAGALLWRKDFAPKWVSTVTFSPDGKVVAFGTSPGNIYLRDARRGFDLCPPVAAHSTYVHQLAYFAGGTMLASAGGDHSIGIWDLRDPSHPRAAGKLFGNLNDLTRLVVLPDDQTIVTGSEDGGVHFWDRRRAGAERKGYLAIDAAEFSFDESGGLLTVENDGRVLRRNPRDPAVASPVMDTGVKGLVNCAAFVNGRLLMHAADRIEAFDLATRKRLFTRPSIEGNVTDGILTPDGRYLVYFADEDWDREFDLTTGVELPRQRAERGRPHWSRTRHGLQRIVTRPDGRGSLIDVSTGRSTPFELTTGTLEDACLSPDGSLMAAVDSDVLLFRREDLRAGVRASPVGRFTFNVGSPQSVAFLPDGTRLAVGGNDAETLKLYDPATRQEVFSFGSGGGSLFRKIEVSPDGNTIAVSDFMGGGVYVWTAPSWEAIEAFEAAAVPRKK